MAQRSTIPPFQYSSWGEPPKFEMWCEGENSSRTAKIGYATSPNETDWTRSGSNPVLSPGTSGKWDDEHVGMPWVIKDGTTYKMWYTVTDDSSAETNIQIGYATCTDGISWSRPDPNNPVLPNGVTND